MARYVVVEFADNDQAEQFVQQLHRDNEFDRAERRRFTTRVVGVFVKPGRVCECPQWSRMNSSDKGIGKRLILRGPKFGWWVCSACKRPRRGSHQLVNQHLPSELYEGPRQHDFEMTVDGLSVTGIHTNNIDRPKRLRRKLPKGAAHGG